MVNFEETNSAWTEKGATLSDKNAMREFGISKNEILDAIKSGNLHYRVNYVFENPYFKLIRKEIESLVIHKYGKKYLKEKKLENELTVTKREINKLKRQLKLLEKKRLEIQSMLEK